MIRRILRRVRRALPASASTVQALRDELREAQADISELRADNLRIAQLHDAVVDVLAKIESSDTPAKGGQ